MRARYHHKGGGTGLVFLYARDENGDMKGMEQMHAPESESKTSKEVAGELVSVLLGEFTKKHLEQLRRGERGLVEQDLAAFIDRAIGVAKAEEGEEFAREIAARFVDEIEFCSAAFQDFTDVAKDAARSAEEKYGLERSAGPEELSEAA